MRKEFEINGCVEVPPEVTEDEFSEAFLKFIESRGWRFGGGIKEIQNGCYVMPDSNLKQDILDNKSPAKLKPTTANYSRVKEGMQVVLYDFTYDEEVTYEMVSQNFTTQYTGFSFDEDGKYEPVSKKFLSTGGNGINTVSIESPLGKALKGHQIDDIITYKNLSGQEERFRIVDIRKI